MGDLGVTGQWLMGVEWMQLGGKTNQERYRGSEKESRIQWTLVRNRRGKHVRVLRSSSLGRRAIKDVTVREQMEPRGQIPGLSSDNQRG